MHVKADHLSTECSGDGLLLARPEEQKLEYALRFRFLVSNNKAEYKALFQRI